MYLEWHWYTIANVYFTFDLKRLELSKLIFIVVVNTKCVYWNKITVRQEQNTQILLHTANLCLILFNFQVGGSMETFLKETGPAQPFILCVGERKNCIQNFYIVLDQKAIPCATQTGVAAFDELFKAHYAFAVSYDEALHNFYTFIQTTVYGIDVGSVKESPRVREIRARILQSAD